MPRAWPIRRLPRPGLWPAWGIGPAPISSAPMRLGCWVCDKRAPEHALATSVVTLMAVTGMANLAVKVRDSELDSACAWYVAAGATVTEPVAWENGRRADVQLGTLALTLFTKAIYEDASRLPEEGFLHPALFVDDLDAE